MTRGHGVGRGRVRFAIPAALLAAGCFGPSEPQFVEYGAVLQSPNGAEGAAVIEVAGNGISDIASDADQFYSSIPGPRTRLVLILNDPGTIRFTVTAVGGEDPPTATVIGVSDGTNQRRTSLAGYAVEFHTVGTP